MRVLQVVHGYPPSRMGGTEIHTQVVARELAGRGHQVTVLAARSDRPGADTHPEVAHDGSVEVLWVPAASRLIDDTIREQFKQVVADQRPDVVHVQHLLHLSADLVEAASSLSVPTVVSLHDLWFQCRLPWPRQRDRHPFRGGAWGIACAWHAVLRRPRTTASLLRHRQLSAALVDALRAPSTMRRQLSEADAILAPSSFIVDAFVRFGVPVGKLRLMPHACDVDVRSTSRDFHAPVRFGFVGTILPEKGPDVLCRAFRGLGRDTSLSLYGAAPDPRFLRRVLRLLGPGMRYAGPFARGEAASVYDEMDVLVVPSLFAESFNLSAAEAQARGLPVIASRIGALPERVTHDQNGLLVSPGDVKQLRGALSTLSDPAVLRRMAAAVRPPRSMTDYVVELESIYAGVRRRQSEIGDVEVSG